MNGRKALQTETVTDQHDKGKRLGRAAEKGSCESTSHRLKQAEHGDLLTPSCCSRSFRPGLPFITSDSRKRAPQAKLAFCSALTCSSRFTKALTRRSTMSAFRDLYSRLRNMLCLEDDDRPGSSNFLQTGRSHAQRFYGNHSELQPLKNKL